MCISLIGFGAASAWQAISVSILISRVKDPESAVRRDATNAAALELSKCGWRPSPFCDSLRTVKALIAALKDPDAEVRINAASALGFSRNPRAVEPLIATLKETNDEIREATRAMNNRAVVDGSEDADSGARCAAAEALSEIGDPRAIEPLIAALEDTNVSVRIAAATALGALKDRRAIEPLIAVLKDMDDFSRGQAARSLGSFKDPRVAETLIEALRDDWLHGTAAETLDRIKGDPGVAGQLIAAITDPDPRVRGVMAELLGGIDDPGASKPLIDTLLKDPDDNVRLNAAKALVRRGGPASEAALIAVLDTRPTRDIANWLLNSGNPKLVHAVKSRFSTTVREIEIPRTPADPYSTH